MADQLDEKNKIRWLPGEKYDGFTGALTYLFDDFVIPGNGLDLSVKYDWEGMKIPKLLGVDPRYTYSQSSEDGGINGREPCFARSSYVQERGTHQNNPVLEFHDRKIHFYPKDSIVDSSEFPSNATYVNEKNWYISCDQGLGGTVHAPNGIQYYFDFIKEGQSPTEVHGNGFLV